MTFAYTILPSPLHQTANQSVKWFMDNLGISKASVVVEQPIHSDVELRPTFSAPTRDFHILCIEVAESIYANHLNACVVSCMHHGLPVKLYVAVPKNTKDPNYGPNLKAAKQAGVGIIEIDNATGTGFIVQNALSISLTSVRPIEVSAFAKKYREALLHAEQTFRDGTPEKACSLVYDEMENLFRKIATKTHKKGWWPYSGNLKKLHTVPWATLIKDWDKSLDRSKCPCPDLNSTLMARILGITTYRNDSGHKPKNEKELIKRDRQLRTRFENAVDLFRELVDASKPLKV